MLTQINTYFYFLLLFFDQTVSAFTVNYTFANINLFSIFYFYLSIKLDLTSRVVVCLLVKSSLASLKNDIEMTFLFWKTHL